MIITATPLLTEPFSGLDIILASASPRRRELMEMAGIPFRVVVRPVDEAMPANLGPIDVVKHLCREKAKMFSQELRQANTVVITADTIVVCDRQIMNKPADAEEAFLMLTRLSGRWHDVHTGVCLRMHHKAATITDTTRVHFRKLSEAEITHYVDHYKPFDKAGAYGIQEWIGFIGIDRIEGSYANVVGLPVHRVYAELLRLTQNHKP